MRLPWQRKPDCLTVILRRLDELGRLGMSWDDPEYVALHHELDRAYFAAFEVIERGGDPLRAVDAANRAAAQEESKP